MISGPDLTVFVNNALKAPIVALDTEASGQEIRDGRGYGIGVSLAYRRSPTSEISSIYVPFRHRRGPNVSREILSRIQVLLDHQTVVLHNAKFDIVSLRSMGLELAGEFWDTMLMAHMVNENWVSKRLDWLGKELLGEGKTDQQEVRLFAKARGGWDGVPPEVMEPYARQDAELTLRLYEYLRPKFTRQGLDDLWGTEQQFVRLLVLMESRGVRIDTRLCREQATHGRQRMDLISKELHCNPGSPRDLEFLLLGELGLPIYKTTPGGKPCFDKFAMELYEADLERLNSPVAKLVKEYRGWSKACAVAYEGYPALLSPDGRLRPNYKMHGTVTGRLSCEKPNLQQIPRVSQNSWDGALKSLFIEDDGYELWEADYSQLELRLGAAYARENSLLAEFAKPDSDVFTRMAAELGFSRNDTKTLTYTLQYGGGINRISNVFGVSAPDAERIRSTYFDTYPGFKRLPQQASSRAKARGYVKMWTGRRRHFERPEEEAHKAFNAVIQGGAAEIVKRTMLRLQEEVDNGTEISMLLQVHDSVVFRIKREVASDATAHIKEVMERVEPDFGVRFACQVKEWGK